MSHLDAIYDLQIRRNRELEAENTRLKQELEEALKLIRRSSDFLDSVDWNDESSENEAGDLMIALEERIAAALMGELLRTQSTPVAPQAEREEGEK